MRQLCPLAECFGGGLFKEVGEMNIPFNKGYVTFIAGLLVVSSHVKAEDFTINVGLELKELHADVQKVEVQCQVQSTTDPGGGGMTVGRGKTQIPVPASGSINQTVQVAFDAAFSDPAYGKSYVCTLILVGPGGTSCAPPSNGQYIWCDPKPGTQLVRRREGPIS